MESCFVAPKYVAEVPRAGQKAQTAARRRGRGAGRQVSLVYGCASDGDVESCFVAIYVNTVAIDVLTGTNSIIKIV